jgi:hypothetical protein
MILVLAMMRYLRLAEMTLSALTLPHPLGKLTA